MTKDDNVIPPAVANMLSGILIAVDDMSDDELMIVLGCILAVLGKRIGTTRTRGATNAALSAMDKAIG